jgi:hypothetical protein
LPKESLGHKCCTKSAWLGEVVKENAWKNKRGATLICEEVGAICITLSERSSKCMEDEIWAEWVKKDDAREIFVTWLEFLFRKTKLGVPELQCSGCWRLGWSESQIGNGDRELHL